MLSCGEKGEETAALSKAVFLAVAMVDGGRPQPPGQSITSASPGLKTQEIIHYSCLKFGSASLETHSSS